MPKDRTQWTFLGKANPGKIQLPELVNGAAIYGIDVRLPNMVYAALRQSPVHGGTLKSYDADAVKHMPGVLAVVALRPKENVPSDLKPVSYTHLDVYKRQVLNYGRVFSGRGAPEAHQGAQCSQSQEAME